MSWKQTLDNNPELRLLSNWPVLVATDLPKAKQKGFKRNLNVVDAVLKGEKLQNVGLRYSMSAANISGILKRCLVHDENGNLPLTQALVPHSRIKRYDRKKALPSSQAAFGYSGQFTRLLNELCGLKSELDEIIISRAKRHNYAQVLTTKSFHGRFKHLLKTKYRLGSNDYPFNTSTCAYESLRKYLKQRQLEIEFRATAIEEEVSLYSSVSDQLAFDEIQIDEQCVDAFASFYIQLNSSVLPLRVARVSVILAKDASSKMYLGKHIAFTRQANQEDMLCLIQNMVLKNTHNKLCTPGLAYLPGASFPCEHQKNISFHKVKLDNAFMHLASSVRGVFCDIFGATVNFGLPSQPTHRALVEQAIQLVNDVSHSFDSTTGSRSNDPIRETTKNAKLIPHLSLQVFEEALDVVLANYNCTPQSTLGGATPLEIYQHQKKYGPIVTLPNTTDLDHSIFLSNTKSKVHYPKNSSHAPYINALLTKYTGKCLLATQTRHKEVVLVYDRRDVRNVDAYSIAGDKLGQLFAPRSWRQFPHSFALRQYIKKLIRENRFSSQDPLAGLFNYLLQNKELPKHALEVARLFQQTGNAELVYTAVEKDNTESDVKSSNELSKTHSELKADMPSEWSIKWAAEK